MISQSHTLSLASAVSSLGALLRLRCLSILFFFFKQKTAYEIGLGIPAEPLSDLTRRRLRSFAASWLLNALLRIFAMSIITPKRKVLRMSVQDCWRPPL